MKRIIVTDLEVEKELDAKKLLKTLCYIQDRYNGGDPLDMIKIDVTTYKGKNVALSYDKNMKIKGVSSVKYFTDVLSEGSLPIYDSPEEYKPIFLKDGRMVKVSDKYRTGSRLTVPLIKNTIENRKKINGFINDMKKKGFDMSRVTYIVGNEGIGLVNFYPRIVRKSKNKIVFL